MTSKSSSPQDLSVSVIIPTYNERENIDHVVERCLQALSMHKFEILIVDDDSPDRTWEVVQERYRDNSCVNVVRRTSDKGLSQAVSEGFRRANNDVCVVLDADLQHPPEKIPGLLDAINEDVDIAIGSRYIDGGEVEGWSLKRKAVSKGAALFSKLLVPKTRLCSDSMSGFFAVRREIVQNIDLDPEGYKILLEILVKCDYDSIAEIPYRFKERERGESKLTVGEYQSYVEHVLMLSTVSFGTALARKSRAVVRMLEFFSVGACGALVNMGTFAVFSYGFNTHFLISGIVAFIVALNFNFIGNYMITFNRPETNLRRTYVKFNLVSVVGLILYSITLTGAVEVAQLPELIANGVAILVGAIFNFVGSEKFAFPDSNDHKSTTTDSATGKIAASDGGND